MTKLDFVDTHVHFYDMQHPELFYAHWQPDVVHPTLGIQIRKLGEQNFVAEDYVSLTRNANVTKAIHVQAAIGSKDPVKETEWIQEAADRTGFPHGIVAYADLREADVDDMLARHAEFPLLRGIRDFSYGDYLVEPDFHRGFALLEKYSLSANMSVQWQDMEKLRDLAGRFPNIQMVVDHTGLPAERNNEYFQKWKQGLITAAEPENTVCKISGLGMSDNDWTVDSIRPFVLHCIETFGIDRCIFGTNWPVDSLFSEYGTIVDAYTEIIADFTEDEQTALLSRNAKAFYSL
jgi:predicted TIM-barrel fold metal-dependent hydrolase